MFRMIFMSNVQIVFTENYNELDNKDQILVLTWLLLNILAFVMRFEIFDKNMKCWIIEFNYQMDVLQQWLWWFEVMFQDGAW